VLPVRFVLPAVLRSLILPVQDGIAVLAIIILTPEYLLTTTLRSFGQPPQRLAYDLGDSMSWAARAARAARTAVRVPFGTFSRTARGLHPLVAALAADGIALGYALADGEHQVNRSSRSDVWCWPCA
jgi:hypothetical protein